MKRQKINLRLKIPALAVTILTAATLILGYLVKSLRNLDYFNIKDIVASQDNIIDPSYLKGQNIFSVDLERQAQYLNELNPIYKKIRLTRVLPNRIYVDFLKRKPLAYIKLYKYFSVDRDGVLFDMPEMTEDINLPVILGLETKVFGPKLGKKISARELDCALNIINEFQAPPELKNWEIKKIDVANTANVSFFMEAATKSPGFQTVEGTGPLEVKIGRADAKAKINILSGLLIQLKKDRIDIKYIDLRFKEPVVKFRDRDAKR